MITIESRRAAARAACFAGAAIVYVAVLAVQEAEARFDLATVAERARELADKPFREPAERVPEWLQRITYDQWREVRFRPERTPSRARCLPFAVQFFHPGMHYRGTITFRVVDADGIQEVPFSPSLFDYGENKFGSQVPQDLGFAGFRLHYPINRADYRDEVIVFLGGSNFRAVGSGLGFGLSARGLAINTATAPSGSEETFFREFWLVRPAPNARSAVLYALLDSPSVAGAYRFAVTPGRETFVDVEARLFLRAQVSELGVAPLNGMFLFGENRRPREQDYRPEVHDVDGLLIATENGERLWRPLDNPERRNVSVFALRNPKGFGLFQRDRDFDHYQDLETRPDLRPNAWVVPRKGFSQGVVQLVEMPAETETKDNIAVAWVPEHNAKRGESVAFSYRIVWSGEEVGSFRGGRVIATRRDRGAVERAYRLVVDFAGPILSELPATAPVRGIITTNSDPRAAAEILDRQVVKNPLTGAWRLVFQVRPAGDQPVELRAFLQRGSEVLSETWVYTLVP